MQNTFTPASSLQPRYRSGAVARMVRIPVSTLRIWERRYQVVGPTLTPSGHRLYSGGDVERLLLIKQLVDRGHAIGSLAGLPTPALLEIADARAALDAAPAPAPPLRPRAVLLGLGLPRRLGALGLQRVATWADLASAEAALATTEAGHLAPADAPAVRPAGVPAGAPTDASAASAAPTDASAAALPAPRADLLVAELATLQPESADRLLALLNRLGVRRSLVVYGFGNDAAAQRLRQAGCRLLRMPLADDELRAAVAEVVAALQADSLAALNAPATLAPAEAVPARRFDEATLRQLAAAPSTVACECPRHLAELVMQLGNFETYSAECVARSPADLALHAHLLQVAGMARAMFEGALLRVAEAEQLPLPPWLAATVPTATATAII